MDAPGGWDALDRLKVGQYGEYLAKMAFARSGYDIYAPEIDDKAIDLVLRLDTEPVRYLEVQIKTVRPRPRSYVFVKKKTFALTANRYLGLVVLHDTEEPALYVIPALAWSCPHAPFCSYDFVDRSSTPEYGLTVSPATLPALTPYRFPDNFIPGEETSGQRQVLTDA